MTQVHVKVKQKSSKVIVAQAPPLKDRLDFEAFEKDLQEFVQGGGQFLRHR